MTHRTHRSLWLKHNSGFIYLFIYFWCLGFFPPAESDQISLNRVKYSAASETLCILQRFYCSLGAACEHGCNIKKEKGWGIKIHFSFSLDFKTRSRVTLSYLGSCAQCPIVRPPPLSCGLKGREGKGEEGREMEAGGGDHIEVIPLVSPLWKLFMSAVSFDGGVVTWQRRKSN